MVGSGISYNPSVTHACHLPLHKGGYGRSKPLPYEVNVVKPWLNKWADGGVSHVAITWLYCQDHRCVGRLRRHLRLANIV